MAGLVYQLVAAATQFFLPIPGTPSVRQIVSGKDNYKKQPMLLWKISH